MLNLFLTLNHSLSLHFQTDKLIFKYVDANFDPAVTSTNQDSTVLSLCVCVFFFVFFFNSLKFHKIIVKRLLERNLPNYKYEFCLSILISLPPCKIPFAFHLPSVFLLIFLISECIWQWHCIPCSWGEGGGKLSQ